MSKFQFGNVTATNMQQGDHTTMNVGGGLSHADREEVLALLQQLRNEIQAAPISDSSKQEVADKIVPAMQQAAASPEARSGITQGLEKVNTHLKEADTAGKNLIEIAGTAAKIAGLVGTGVKIVAPFLAGLL